MTLDSAETAPASAVLDALRDRRSAPRFSPAPVPRELLEDVVEAARWAPNHHLTEPWRLFVLTGAAREALGETMAAEILRDAATNPRAEAEATGIRTKLRRSPVLIVVAQARNSEEAGSDRDLEDYAACACATQNLLLAAHARGLAAKWSTGKAVRSADTRAFLGLAPEDRIVAYVYLGYPEGDPPPTSRRRPTHEVTSWHGWDGEYGPSA
jgi:nitroreductase